MVESSPSLPRYQSAAYLDWVALFLAALVFVVLGWVWQSTGETALGFVSTLGIPLLIGLSVSRRAVVDTAERLVTETLWLFGRMRLGVRRTALEQFSAIVYKLRKRDTDEWWVGIRHRSGRTIWLRDFGVGQAGGPPRAAEEFAWRLHCDTGIDIQEHKRRKRS